MGDLFRDTGLCKMVLTEFCPAKNKVSTYEFTCDLSGPMTAVKNEILLEEGILFYGTGKKEALSVCSEDPDLSPYHIIKRVIQTGQVPSVGGGIQTGETTNGNFNILGVQDYSDV